MKRAILSVLLAGAAAAPSAGTSQSASAPPAAPAAAEKNWRALARQDVIGAYELYVANHPGMHDPLNKDFPERLTRARDAGLAIADQTTDRSGYVEALGAFSAELQDGHAQAFAKQPPASADPPKFQWPGFVAAWRGDNAVVHHAGAGSPAPAGSVILACDGAPVKEVVLKRLSYRGFRPKEEGHWWSRGPQAFYSTPLYSKHRPERCTFRTPDGQQREATLSYVPAPDNFMTLLELATDGDRLPIGLTEPRPGIFLAGLQNFQPNADDVKAYRALFDTVRARRAELAKANAVVIDLRYNNGGSSSWSHQFAEALWGEAFEPRIDDYLKDVRIWWRASKDNVAYMSEMEAKIRRDGNVEVADGINSIGAGMKAAFARGEPFYVEGEDKASKTYPATLPASDFTTPVYVITPGRCASACLDAVDAFKRFPNVKLIGAPTSGDSTYMEVRSADLPSGEGRVVIPNKIWMKRPRGSGEVYRPDIEMRDLDWSTAGFLNRIEEDLAARR